MSKEARTKRNSLAGQDLRDAIRGQAGEDYDSDEEQESPMDKARAKQRGSLAANVFRARNSTFNYKSANKDGGSRLARGSLFRPFGTTGEDGDEDSGSGSFISPFGTVRKSVAGKGRRTTNLGFNKITEDLRENGEQMGGIGGLSLKPRLKNMLTEEFDEEERGGNRQEFKRSNTITYENENDNKQFRKRQTDVNDRSRGYQDSENDMGESSNGNLPMMSSIQRAEYLKQKKRAEKLKQKIIQH